MSTPEREALRKLWNLSMHDHCPIWLGGAIQELVKQGVGASSAGEVEATFGLEPRLLTEGEAEEIRDLGRRVMAGDYEALR